MSTQDPDSEKASSQPPNATLPAELASCLSIDLELSPRNNTLRAIAAYRPDTGDSLSFRGPPTPQQWQQLEALADTADFLVGHNLIAFDAPHLRALNPAFTALLLPQVDTLMLNPLAFPRNPYHHLVKHYRDGTLYRTTINDPLLDSQLAVQALANQVRQLAGQPFLQLTALHHLTTLRDGEGFDTILRHVRGQPAPDHAEGRQATTALLEANCCPQAARALTDSPRAAWPLAFILAWLPTAGENSVISPWVFHQYPETARLLKQLRDSPCGTPDCPWCVERHDATPQLKRWFGFDSYRPKPADKNGNSLQQTITTAAMAGANVLGILPTGTGKSACYQVPALSRYDATGALTVVISPLQALMLDQIATLESQGLTSAAALNALLSLPQRADVTDRVRRGDISILLISPEQLRSPVLAKTLEHRQIAAWVLDEAHCLSKWGHDFRPDYRYIGRFIRNHHRDQETPPILCLTATAKPDVKQEIVEYFEETLDTTLQVIDGGAARPNLEFSVIPTTPANKLPNLADVLNSHLSGDSREGAIIYCATRRTAETTAAYLRNIGWNAIHFHGGLTPEAKRDTQRSFASGETQIVVATNAFGMGIDKPDVRLVVHQDIPGSLENYLQEAGRAGRDNDRASCVLLYDPQDADRQHALSAANKLTRTDIQAVIKSLRALHRKNTRHGPDQPVIATSGEILREDENHEFQRLDGDDRTRVTTAVSWLEESRALTRLHNQTTIYPSSIQVPSLSAAEQRLRTVHAAHRPHMRTILQEVLNASDGHGISTDELSTLTGLGTKPLQAVLHDLAELGLLHADQRLTAFVRHRTTSPSTERFRAAAALELDLIRHLQEQAPDQDQDQSHQLHLQHTTQYLNDNGHKNLLPLIVQRTLRAMAAPDESSEPPRRHLRIRNRRYETIEITLLTTWSELEVHAERRQAHAKAALDHLLAQLPQAASGADLPATTTMSKLTDALRQDMFHNPSNPPQELQTALVWLHDQEVIRLHNGLTIMRPAMTIHMGPPGQNFTQNDYHPLQLHYDDQTRQIHIIAHYAETSLKSVAESLALVADYFALSNQDFLNKWFAGRLRELTRPTTDESWNNIVTSLNNRDQQALVANDDRTKNNLVLAGPGSGKTTMLVHRLAYLIKVLREDPSSIIALAYNRHAAIQIKSRLRQLIGNGANRVTVLTCHAMAMRLAGRTFANYAATTNREATDIFDEILQTATALLEGSSHPDLDADEQRDRLLQGYRWILVDEYQDIREHEYRLISALAGRTEADPDAKLTLLAVGDDDQTIYSFRGASTAFIRNFQSDYRARTAYLTQNYRSTKNIIDASNALIARAPHRLKAENPITIDQGRRNHPPGGRWQTLDPVTAGRVHILPAGTDAIQQALLSLQELKRLASRDPGWDWNKVAILSHRWATIQPVRTAARHQNIPVQLGREDFTGTWHLRETQALLEQAESASLTSAPELKEALQALTPNNWTVLLSTALDDFSLETEDNRVPNNFFTDWLAEWMRTNHDTHSGAMLTTAHRAKGLEYDHVVILDGHWAQDPKELDAERRLYYVAMTRAKQTLTLCRVHGAGNPFLNHLADQPSVLESTPTGTLPEMPPDILDEYQQTTLSDVFLSYAGRRTPPDLVHKAIANLQPGDTLDIRRSEDRFILLAPGNIPVGRTSSSFKPARQTRPKARVLAIARWNKSKSDPAYHDRLRTEAWEVVIPEFIYPVE